MEKKKLLVLFVENDDFLLKIMTDSLKRDYSVISTNCKESAMKIFSQNHEEIDVVIVDFYMQHGVTLLKEISEMKPCHPIITISGSPLCSAEEGCEFCGINYNRKRLMMPFDKHVLIEAIESFDKFQCQLKNDCMPPTRNDDSLLF